VAWECERLDRRRQHDRWALLEPFLVTTTIMTTMRRTMTTIMTTKIMTTTTKRGDKSKAG
jgi:hypothetical protein